MYGILKNLENPKGEILLIQSPDEGVCPPAGAVGSVAFASVT
jgi:hypothetical protein